MKAARLIGPTILAMSWAGSAALATEAVVDLPDLAVRALHYPLPLDAYPGVARLIGRAEIEATASANVQELLARAGGLDFRSFSGSPADAEIHLRGFGEGSGSRVLVLVDGLRLNRPDMGGINWLQVPLSAVERIEVLRGGQAVIYGHQAIGGVVKISTRAAKPGAESGGELTLAGGSDGFYQGSAFTMGGTSRAAFAASVEALGADGFRDNSAYAGGSLFLTTSRKVGHDGIIRAALTYTDFDAERPGPLTSVGFPENPRRSVVDDQNFGESTRALGLHTDLPAGDHRFSADAALRERERGWNLSGTHADNRNRSAQLSPRFHASLQSLDLVGGADLEREELRAHLFTTAQRAAPFARADLRRSTVALYGHGRVLLTSRMEAFAGARAEHTSLDFHYAAGSPFQTTPILEPRSDERRADTGYAVSFGWLGRAERLHMRAWGRMDRVYRYPLTDEIAAYQGFALGQTFNTNLAPEEGWQREAGWAWERGAAALSITLFQIDLENEIIYNFRINENTNYPRTRRRGLEVEARAETGPLTWAGTFHHTSARYGEGDFADRHIYLVPSWTARASVVWQAHKNLRLRLDGRHSARQFEGNDFANTRAPLPASTVFDAGFHGSLPAGLQWHLSVTNLFDRGYASVKYLGDWYPADGRSWRAGLRIPF
ncbi:MAG: TonB-dependent receptor [Opitutales bacterium]|nr:TonB-dependent receptor [Opitutales bacterium]